MRTRRGIARQDVVGMVIASILVLAVAMAALKGTGRHGRSMRDAFRIGDIHRGWIVFAGDFDGSLPLPSVHALRKAGRRGPEDHTLNHTAGIYGMSLALNYMPPQYLISPLETAPHVRHHEFGRPFVMRIDEPSIGANASYAHLAPVGDRRARWRDGADASIPIVGTRGLPPDAGEAWREWRGTLSFGDLHTETLESTDGTAPKIDGDAIHAADRAHPMGNEAAADAFVAIAIAASQYSVEEIYDRRQPATRALPAQPPSPEG